MRSLALLRVLAGLVVLLHLEPFLSDSLDGRTYLDAFHEPYAAWYPEVPEAAYIGLLWLAAIAAVAMSLGLLTRVATATTFSLVAYNLFLSTTHFHNNRAYLVIVLGLLAVAPCGRELSLDSWLRRRRGRPALVLSAPAWPLWLLRFESSAVYAASGLSKLLDPDWFGGTVTWQRVVRARDDLEATPLPDWAISVLTDRGFHSGVAPMIVFTELFIAPGCGGGAPATWPSGSPSSSMSRSNSGVGPGVLAARDRGAAGLGGALDPGPIGAARPRRRPPPAVGRGGARPRLAGAVPRRAGSARRSA